MATTPEAVRRGLKLVTDAAQADTRAVAAAAEPADVRAALFAAAPIIVGDYADGAAALALDWYEELRDAAGIRRPFQPRPLTLVTDDDVRAMVAVATETLRDIDKLAEELLAEITEQAVADVAYGIQKEVAAGFWDTATGNANEDPEAVGWQRFARPDGCKFCLMLAGRGAVYTEGTVDFAAHTSCHCVVGPSFDPDAPRASVMQYVASQKRRTPEQRAALREYLNQNFPDAPG